ncbi:alkaline phosphatase-like protein [Wallemia mellicola]|uniref:Alkaline phosphatase n=1 Tax=Wallemia mellicola TaxID=1708541 RepID=A0AB38MNK1_9BASI|nr:hypothetical protein E3Q24_02556 [Wallemia mellicola]TIB87403.1 alkaline phosphatase-like protein [Wallemia mellicola]TIB90310.1 alkaline phosphatase-like protein [Wallemia mellicola]TIC36458.1 alkaline phosphatase-like protein [Wallemia mellicola]TIC42153.1 alkaline phosphatase-like protein [Wallemia mellicola]
MKLPTSIGLFCALALVSAQPTNKEQKNVILSISDGLGLPGLTMSREYVRNLETNGNFLNYTYQLPLDDDMVGSLRTSSANTYITDSAAAGTAMATGKKTLNNALGVDVDGNAIGSVLEAAKLAGMHTALVTNSYVSDATPGAFNVHSQSRDDYWFIAEQILGFRGALGIPAADIVIGGGYCPFIPKSAEGSCRPDDRDLLQEAQEKGWTVARTIEELNEADSTPLIGVFDEKAMNYTLDLSEDEPSLMQMAEKALEILIKLSNEDGKGFFIMVEEGIIDYAGHDNDPVAHVSSTLNHMNVHVRIKELLKQINGETLVVATSDHDTGQLGLGTSLPTDAELGEYQWKPEVLANAKHSGDYISKRLRELTEITSDVIIDAFKQYSGIEDPTEEEIKRVLDAEGSSSGLSDAFNIAVSNRARVGWTTRAHTAADVPVYCYGSKYCDQFKGSIENTELPQLIEDYLKLDINNVSEMIKDFNTNATEILGRDTNDRDVNHQ